MLESKNLAQIVRLREVKNWKEMYRRHLRKNDQTLYHKLASMGILDQEINAVVERAWSQVSQVTQELMQQGKTKEQAEEIAKELALEELLNAQEERED